MLFGKTDRGEADAHHDGGVELGITLKALDNAHHDGGITPKALHNLSPGLERSDNPGNQGHKKNQR